MVDYLGNNASGILFPPQRGVRGFFNTAKGKQLISSNLYTLFHTRPGEMPGVPEFGNSAYYMLDEPLNSTTQTLIVKLIQEDIARWEPRVSVVSIKTSTDNNTLYISLVLRIKSETDTFEYNDVLKGASANAN